MEIKDDLTGQSARLPDGQRVKIEIVHEDGFATVRRTEGEWGREGALALWTNWKSLSA